MFSYSCPSCAQKLLAPPERAGQRTICPKCLKPLSIPTPGRAEDADDPADGLLHSGPLVDDDAPTHPTTRPPASDVTPTPGGLTPEPIPVLTRPEFDPYPTPPEPVRPTPRPEPPVPAPARPPARVGTAVATRPAADPAGRVQFHPTGIAGADLAAGLAADLTMRMKPPPEPSADLMLTTLVWLGLTSLAAVLWVAGVVYDAQALPFVALIGSLLAAVGYLWAGYLAGQHDPLKGLLTLLPPVAAVRLFRPFGANGYRPLRYVLTGCLLLALYFAAPAARSAVQQGLDRLQPSAVTVPPPPLTPAEKVRGRKTADGLLAELSALAEPEVARAAAPEVRAELVAELRGLSDPAREGRAEVRTAALAALAVWQPDATRGPVLAALKSADSAERRQGLALAGRWADPDLAAAVAARLSDRLESADAQKALRVMGGPAEEVLLPLLKTEERAATLLVVMELLGEVGGPRSIAALRQLETAGASPSVRDEAKARADGLAARLKK